jgi:hypothetical protein
VIGEEIGCVFSRLPQPREVGAERGDSIMQIIELPPGIDALNTRCARNNFV